MGRDETKRKQTKAVISKNIWKQTSYFENFSEQLLADIHTCIHIVNTAVIFQSLVQLLWSKSTLLFYNNNK